MRIGLPRSSWTIEVGLRLIVATFVTIQISVLEIKVLLQYASGAQIRFVRMDPSKSFSLSMSVELQTCVIRTLCFQSAAKI